MFDSSSIAGVEWINDAIEEFRAQLGNEALSLRVSEFESETGLCVCSLSFNSSPIDFSPLLSSMKSPQDFGGEGVDESSHPPAPGNQDVIEGLSSESPSFMFLQRLDCQAELDTLSVEIEQCCASFAEKQHQEIFQEGDFVLVQYSDEVWYRAKVVEAGADASFRVFFIDFGNMETISQGKMVMCPENYLELPCQTIACSLTNVPRCDSWPDEYKNLLDEQVSDRVMKVKLVHPASKGMRPTVNIEDKETGADVAETVLNYLHDECEQGNVSNYVIPEEPEEEEEEDSQNSDQVTPKVDPVTTDQPNPKSVEVKSQQSQSTGSSSSVLQRSLEFGSEYEVYLVSYESPHSFFVQLASDTEALEEISAALESAYENRDTSDLVLSRPPNVGEYVCSQFSEDLK